MKSFQTLSLALFLGAALSACGVSIIEFGDEEDLTHDHHDDDGEVENVASPLLANGAPVPMRSGAWWGDTGTPLVNQLWGEILNATPDKNLTSPFTYEWTCKLPTFPGNPQTLKLHRAQFQLTGQSNHTLMNAAATAGQVLKFTVDPAKFPAGWYEVRMRCVAEETVGPEKGQRTAITAGFPVQLKGGTASGGNHNRFNYLDTHGWYSRNVGYSYARIRNISELVAGPVKGIVRLNLEANRHGNTTVDHFMLKINDQIARDTAGKPVELHGKVTSKTVDIDTRTLPNGLHTFAMHSHAIESASSGTPGMQIAAQVEVTVEVRN